VSNDDITATYMCGHYTERIAELEAELCDRRLAPRPYHEHCLSLRGRIAELEAELSEAYDDARGLRECIREQSELNEYLRENMDACGEASMATHLDMMAQCDAAEAEARRLRDIMCQSLRIECTAECVAECTAEAVDKRCSQCGGSGSVDIERGFATVPCPKCEEAK